LARKIRIAGLSGPPHTLSLNPRSFDMSYVVTGLPLEDF
jgi:hypothetical protein